MGMLNGRNRLSRKTTLKTHENLPKSEKSWPLQNFLDWAHQLQWQFQYLFLERVAMVLNAVHGANLVLFIIIKIRENLTKTEVLTGVLLLLLSPFATISFMVFV